MEPLERRHNFRNTFNDNLFVTSHLVTKQAPEPSAQEVKQKATRPTREH